jgi:hypothetical protein
MGTISSALTAFVIAAAGVGVAVCWFSRHPWAAILPLVGLAAIGLACDWYGRNWPLPERPIVAVRWIEWWVLVPGVVAALFSGLLIILGVWFEPGEKASVEEKKLLAACAGALAALVTTLGVKGAEESDTKWIADRVKKAFHSRYQRHDPAKPHEPGVAYFRAESEGERWVYGTAPAGVEGWGWKARRQRAAGVAARLASPDRVM